MPFLREIPQTVEFLPLTSLDVDILRQGLVFGEQ